MLVSESTGDREAQPRLPPFAQPFGRVTDADGDVWVVPEHVRPVETWEVPSREEG